MKFDMSPSAVTRRLKQAQQLRRACLVLANSSAAQRIRSKYAANQLGPRMRSAADRCVGAIGTDAISAYIRASNA